MESLSVVWALFGTKDNLFTYLVPKDCQNVCLDLAGKVKDTLSHLQFEKQEITCYLQFHFFQSQQEVLFSKVPFSPKFHWHFNKTVSSPSLRCETVWSGDKKVSYSLQKNKSNQVTRQVKTLFSFPSKVEQEVRRARVGACGCECYKRLTTKAWNFLQISGASWEYSIYVKKIVCLAFAGWLRKYSKAVQLSFIGNNSIK